MIRVLSDLEIHSNNRNYRSIVLHLPPLMSSI